MPSNYNGKTKFIIVTGGVLSGLGKGVTAASIGHLLCSKYKVVPLKLDGYLNVDPGTMNPIEHGEVFVLDDGGEVDMDFGHYERFLDIQCKTEWNLTMGKVFDGIMKHERKGKYLGKTVQFIPHVTDYIKERFYEISKKEDADFLLIEVGGTVGDLENELYLEACRQLCSDVGKENVMYVHLTYVPILAGVNEQKSKPTQQSVNLLRQRGINPDIIVGRCKSIINPKLKNKIATFCNVPQGAVITGLDVDNIYTIPYIYIEEGVLDILNKHFNLKLSSKEIWEKLLENKKEKKVDIAICGKYTDLEDSYASVVEAINHSCANLDCSVNLVWIETTDLEKEGKKDDVKKALAYVDGVIVPGGFGSRGVEGKIEVIKFCRENKVPFLGLCYGMQLAVVEYARNVVGIPDANSIEINSETKDNVIDFLPEQRNLEDKGATMRLGGHNIKIKKDTFAHSLFGDMIRLRFRHRLEVNQNYVEKLEKAGLVFSGKAENREIMQVMELPKDKHPFFMATQAHPELTSKLEKPSPFFFEFVKKCIEKE